MKLSGQVVLFRLTAVGRQALGEQVSESGTFEARVDEEDEHGLWINMPEEQYHAVQQAGPVMLLKWDFVATVTLLYPSSS